MRQVTVGMREAWREIHDSVVDIGAIDKFDGLQEEEVADIKESLGSLFSFAVAKDQPVVAVEPHF